MNAVKVFVFCVFVAMLCYCEAEGFLLEFLLLYPNLLIVQFKISVIFNFLLKIEIDWSKDPPLVVWNRVKDKLPIPPAMATGFTKFFEWCSSRPRNPLCFSPLREIINKVNSYNKS